MSASGFDPAHRQTAHAVRFEQGPTGARAVAEADGGAGSDAGGEIAVVVDVLSFTTTLAVATECGVRVWPFRWHDPDAAAAFAAERDAVVAVGRLEAQRESVALPSLSPARLAASVRHSGVTRLVLPSPNGSTICAALADGGAQVVGASLRNAGAVGAWLAPQVRAGARVAVLAAGERWPDGSLRPAVEDVWGAGAVLAALVAGLPQADLSPEARFAVDALESVRPHLRRRLLACSSGRELVERGFADDVEVAARLDAGRVVPLLTDGCFAPA